MKRVNAEYMGHHLWVSFCPNARRFFRNHSYLFEWRCTVTGEVYRDGPTLLILALQRLRPDTVVDVFKKIEILKALRLKDFNLDLPMLIDSLNEKNDEIQDLDPNAYLDTQLASDTFRIFSLDAPEAFRQWMEKEQMNWATGETPFNSFVLQQRATKVFTNLTSTGRWRSRLIKRIKLSL